MADRLVEALQKLRERRVPTLEELLTGPGYFGLTTASKLQRATCRIADGLPLDELGEDQGVIDAVGDPSLLPTVKPYEMHILSAIRTGKSLWAAAGGVGCALSCDVSRLRKGEIPRVPIISTSRDNASVIFAHTWAGIQNSPHLSRLVLMEPKDDTIMIKHPTGVPVEIKVVAGARAGSSLLSRWMAGCIFDEATRMLGSEDGVVNYDDARAAVAGRILPGGQIFTIGSPWAPYGPVYEDFIKFWKKPSARKVVIKAPGWVMNPVLWTPEACAKLKADNESVWITDCAAEFSSPLETYFSVEELRRCTRDAPDELPPMAGAEYVAAMDPATRGNSWTFVVSTRLDGVDRICVARQWTGSKASPLDPEIPISEMAEIARDYHLRGVWTDQWMGDALSSIAKRHGLTIWVRPSTESSKARDYKSLKAKMASDPPTVELCPEPFVRADLQRVKRKPVASGFRIELPKTSDGRHCDFAPPVVMCLTRNPGEAQEKDERHPSVIEAERMMREAEARYRGEGRGRRRRGLPLTPW